MYSLKAVRMPICPLVVTGCQRDYFHKHDAFIFNIERTLQAEQVFLPALKVLQILLIFLFLVYQLHPHLLLFSVSFVPAHMLPQRVLLYVHGVSFMSSSGVCPPASGPLWPILFETGFFLMNGNFLLVQPSSI